MARFGSCEEAVKRGCGSPSGVRPGPWQAVRESQDWRKMGAWEGFGLRTDRWVEVAGASGQVEASGRGWGASQGSW